MDFVYRRPEWGLLFILACAMAILYWRLYAHKMHIRNQFTAVFSVIPTYTDQAFFFQRAACFIFAWILLTAALMQPAIPQKMAPGLKTITPYREIAFILDTSQSMAATDTATNASRFNRAKELIENMLETLGQTPISLYTFAGDMSLECPPTVDYIYFLFTLRGLIVNDAAIPGTNFSRLAETIRDKYHSKKKTFFIILSDGEDTEISDDPATRERQEIELAQAIIKAADDPQSCFETIGIGSLQGAIVPDIEVAGQPVITRLRPHLLQCIADDGYGSCFLDSDQIPQQITKKLYMAATFGNTYGTQQQAASVGFCDLSRYPAMAALFFLAIGLLLPETKKKKGY